VQAVGFLLGGGGVPLAVGSSPEVIFLSFFCLSFFFFSPFFFFSSPPLFDKRPLHPHSRDPNRRHIRLPHADAAAAAAAAAFAGGDMLNRLGRVAFFLARELEVGFW